MVSIFARRRRRRRRRRRFIPVQPKIISHLKPTSKNRRCRVISAVILHVFRVSLLDSFVRDVDGVRRRHRRVSDLRERGDGIRRMR